LWTRCRPSRCDWGPRWCGVRLGSQNYSHHHGPAASVCLSVIAGPVRPTMRSDFESGRGERGLGVRGQERHIPCVGHHSFVQPNCTLALCLGPWKVAADPTPLRQATCPLLLVSGGVGAASLHIAWLFVARVPGLQRDCQGDGCGSVGVLQGRRRSCPIDSALGSTSCPTTSSWFVGEERLSFEWGLGVKGIHSYACLWAVLA
jgi:hypothetical protein